ncbi:MAG: diguanylate cyclase, partial [Xanthomonadales bacterium]|nr:diguanylate cyclase [Xanthomonadales bacterium]
VLLLPLLATAQDTRRRFDALLAVSGHAVHALAEDDNGFVWIGDDHGLLRFNGSRLETVAADAETGSVNALALQQARYLWVAAERGLWRWDLQAESMQSIDCGGDVARFEQLQVGADAVWALSRQGLRRIDASSLACLAVVPGGLPAQQPVERFHADGDAVWLAVRQLGIWRCPRPCTAAQPWALPDTRVRWISGDGDGGLYAGTHRHGLYRLDRDGEVRDHWWRGADAPADRALTTNGILSLARAEDGALYAGLWAGGLMEIAADGAVIARSRPLPHEPSSLGGANVSALLLARNGTLYVGHEHGLSLLDPVRKQLPWIGHATEGQPGLGQGTVRVLAERDGKLLIGSQGGGLTRLDIASGELTPLRMDAARADTLPSDTVWAAAEGKDGRWMLGTSGGLARLSLSTLAVERLASTPALPSDDIVSVSPAKDGGFWLGAWAGGVVKVDADGRVERIWRAEDGLRLATLGDVVEDSLGRVFAGNSEGLFLLGDDGRFHPLTIEARLGSERVPEIAAIEEAVDGTLWAGASNGGLLRWLPDANAPSWVNDAVLSGEAVYRMLPDPDGGVWLGTENGLLLIDRDGNPLQRIDQDAGLAFEGVLSISSSRSGGLWVGGGNGVHRVDPMRLSHRLLNGQPVVTGVRLFNRTLHPEAGGALSASPSRGGVLDLRFDQDMLTLDFALPGLPQPQGVKFRYHLQNFDRDWVEVAGDEPRAVYTRLPPGDYRFEVEAGSTTGWSGRTALLPITVHPPWWMTWWARLLFLLLVAAVIFFWHRLRTLQLRAQAHRLELTVAERTAALRDANAALGLAARTDALSGLANRRGFREEVVERWSSLAGQAWLLLADIDHFKAINDACGHEAGDGVLVAVSDALRSVAAAEDRLARWGGEEFLCLLSGGDIAARAEAMRAAISVLRIAGLPHGSRVTVTAGLTRIRVDEDFASAIRRADALLYEGKRTGRDRLVVDTAGAAAVGNA